MSEIKAILEYVDFAKLDIRVGQIIQASAPEWSRKLLEFTVDFGPEVGKRTIFSGVKTWYAPEDFLQKKAFFVINLAERKMGEGISQGMMLMADETEQPIACFAPDSVALGTSMC